MPDPRAAATALLRQKVLAALSPRRALLDEPRSALSGLDQALAQLDRRIAAADRAAVALHREINLWNRPFSLDFTIQEARQRHPGAAAVFTRHHLPSCDGCAVRFDETLREAAEAYGIDGDALLADLNALLRAG